MPASASCRWAAPCHQVAAFRVLALLARCRSQPLRGICLLMATPLRQTTLTTPHHGLAPVPPSLAPAALTQPRRRPATLWRGCAVL